MISKLIKSTVIAIIAATAAVTITLDSNAARVATENNSPPLYTLKDYNGKIAIYNYNSKIPKEVLDVYIESLPQSDTIQLKSGVYAYSDDELYRLIEDYDG